MPQIRDIVKGLRSKNAGPRAVTFDLLFPDRATYEAVRDSGVLSEERIRDLYEMAPGPVLITPWDQAMAIKITIPRLVPSGRVGDADVYGAQQYIPMMDVTIPNELLTLTTPRR